MNILEKFNDLADAEFVLKISNIQNMRSYNELILGTFIRGKSIIGSAARYLDSM